MTVHKAPVRFIRTGAKLDSYQTWQLRVKGNILPKNSPLHYERMKQYFKDNFK